MITCPATPALPLAEKPPFVVPPALPPPTVTASPVPAPSAPASPKFVPTQPGLNGNPPSPQVETETFPPAPLSACVTTAASFSIFITPPVPPSVAGKEQPPLSAPTPAVPGDWIVMTSVVPTG